MHQMQYFDHMTTKYCKCSQKIFQLHTMIAGRKSRLNFSRKIILANGHRVSSQLAKNRDAALSYRDT
jgi:hypothetical protein